MNRTVDNRKEEARKIIVSLNKLNLNPSYPSVKELYNLLQIYINTGERLEINIDFSEINKKIVGVLAKKTTEQTVVKLQKLM